MGASISEGCSGLVPSKQNHEPLLSLLLSHGQKELEALRPDCYMKGSFLDAHVSSANGTRSARRNVGKTFPQTTREL